MMTKKIIVWTAVGLALVILGCAIFGGAMSMLKWDFLKLTTAVFETNEYEISENYRDIKIITDTADIDIVSGEGMGTKITCYERQNVRHTVGIKDGVLTVEINDTRKWYEHIEIGFGAPKITVYLPAGAHDEVISCGDLFVKGSTGDVQITALADFEDIDISLSTGDISICDIMSKNLSLTVSTGDIDVKNVLHANDVKVRVSTGRTMLENIRCQNITSKGSTGAISMKDVVAKEGISVERSTGSINFDACDANEIFAKTTTGHIKGSLLTDKVFITETDTGSVKVPNSITGGRCELTTNTGSINIEIK